MVRTVVGIVAVAIATLVFFKNDSDYIWLLMNKCDAERYAHALLNEDLEYAPEDKFIDYTVSTKDGYVFFSPHNQSQVLYLYTPKDLKHHPKNLDTAYGWQKLEAGWYVRR